MNEQERQDYDAGLARAQQEDARARGAAAAIRRAQRLGLFIDTIWCRLGAMRSVVLRRAQVRALDAIDLAELRDSFGATSSMIDALLSLAADETDERDVQIDFDAQTVAIVEDANR